MWKINDMKRDASTGFVSEVHWSYAAQDGDFSGSVYGSIALTGELTTPYESLTEAQVIGWVKAVMGAETVAAHEAAVLAQIEAQRNPVVANGLPWGN
jgi:hypothetical protein